MGIIHSKNYSIRKKLFKKIFIQKIWKLFIQKNYSFFLKIDYRPGLSKVDCNARKPDKKRWSTQCEQSEQGDQSNQDDQGEHGEQDDKNDQDVFD